MPSTRNMLPASLGAALLCACSSAPVPAAPPNPRVATTLSTDRSAAGFPGAPDAATAFDARAESAGWTTGDEVVFALQLRKGEEVHRWLLRLEVRPSEAVATYPDGSTKRLPTRVSRSFGYTRTINGKAEECSLTSVSMPVAVTVCDEKAAVLTQTEVWLPADLLGGGLLPAVDASLAAQAPEASGQDPVAGLERIMAAVIGVMSLLNVVQEDDALAPYFWQVVDKPSIWSIVTSFGAKATMTMPFEQSVPATDLPPRLPATDRAYVVPIRIDVNGSAALLADVVAVDAARPYALCGGIVAAVARHPTQPDVRFEIHLLGAKLGK